MLYIISTLLFGVLLGIVSILFREYEIKNKTIAAGKQLLFQMGILFFSTWVFNYFFAGYTLDFGNFLSLNWFVIYVLFSSLSYYMMQVLYEWLRGVSLFPTDTEVEEFIEKYMDK